MKRQADRRRRIAVTIVGLIGIVAPAATRAQTPSGLPGATEETRAEARRLVEKTHLDQLTQKILAGLRQTLIASIAEKTAKPQDQVAPIVDQVLMPEMQAHVGEFIDALVEIYAADFSVEDLRAIEAFYDTPSGQRYLEKLPLISQQSIAAGQAWGKRVAQDAITKHEAELKKRGLGL